MFKYLLAATLVTTATLLPAQEVPTQTLVAVVSKMQVTLKPSDVTLKIDNRSAPVTGLTPVVPGGVQIAILIDDGVRTPIGTQLDDLRSFIQHLPSGVEISIGYMRNGEVVVAQPFTTNLELAAASVRLPSGPPGISGNPYYCLSAFSKRWLESSAGSGQSAPKARFILMIANGVDPNSGNVSVHEANALTLRSRGFVNQDSPNVVNAVRDAQRAGIAVYSIYYYTDAGIRDGAAYFSGKSYLLQVADSTGGTAFTVGNGNPVSMAPFLKQFQNSIGQTYIATFRAPGNQKLVAIKFNTKLPDTKLRAADQVRPGTLQTGNLQ